MTFTSQIRGQQSQQARIISRAKFLALVATVVAATLASPLAWSQDQPQRIEISARRFSYSPGEITVKKGQPVTIVLKSEDVAHGLRIRELGVDMKVKAGETAEVTFTPKIGRAHV